MRANNLQRPIEILLVEDNFDDAEFIKLAFQEAKLSNHVHHVDNGQAALEFLQCPTQARPDLILLDLAMHKMDGQEFLPIVKRNESLRSIPVIVLSTSGTETDVQYAYQHYANCYLQKPAGFTDILQVLTQLQTMWLQIVELPSDSDV